MAEIDHEIEKAPINHNLQKTKPCQNCLFLMKLSVSIFFITIKKMVTYHIVFILLQLICYNYLRLAMKKILATIIVFIISIIAQPVKAKTDLSVTEHLEICDASAAVPIGSDLFAVANDEDNILRIYKNNKSGKPIHFHDLTSFLKIDPDHPEADIEGATLIKDRIYWITSHGSNKDGKKRSNRHRFFATKIETIGDKFSLEPIGTPFHDLVKAFEDAEELKEYQLEKAANNAPESKHGLNIEGLAGTPEGNLLIGFRNPIPKGNALLVPLKNPDKVIMENEKPKLGKPILLPLNGLGIRSIEYSDSKKAYIIIAGPHNDNGTFQLYQWSGNPSDSPKLSKVDFQDLHPEAVIIYPEEKSKIQILSDDGSKQINGKNCKDLTSAQDKSFRSMWVE